MCFCVFRCCKSLLVWWFLQRSSVFGCVINICSAPVVMNENFPKFTCVLSSCVVFSSWALLVTVAQPWIAFHLFLTVIGINGTFPLVQVKSSTPLLSLEGSLFYHKAATQNHGHVSRTWNFWLCKKEYYCLASPIIQFVAVAIIALVRSTIFYLKIESTKQRYIHEW